MNRAIKQDVVVQPGGVIQIRCLGLSPGVRAKVIILLDQAAPTRRLRDMIGAGKGSSATPEEADAFISGERYVWE